MKEFDITKYAEGPASQSFLKAVDGHFAPNRVIYDRRQQEKNRAEGKIDYYFFEGKVIETAVLYPDDFDQKYKIDDTGINTDTKSYEFAKAYSAGRNKKKWGEIRAARVAQRFSRIQSPKSIDKLLEKVAEDGEWEKLMRHFQDFKGKEAIKPELYDIAMKHRDKVYEDHNPLKDFLEDPRCLIEPHLEWENFATGVKCHGFPDISIPKEVKIDLKALRDVSNNELNKPFGPIKKFNYIPQLAAYDEADHNVDGTICYIYAMEKHPLCNWNMKRISDHDIYIGLEKFNKWCAAFKFLNENDLWHMGYEFSTLYGYDSDEMEYVQKTKVAISETNLYF